MFLLLGLCGGQGNEWQVREQLCQRLGWIEWRLRLAYSGYSKRWQIQQEEKSWDGAELTAAMQAAASGDRCGLRSRR